jgi:hypothetical protein
MTDEHFYYSLALVFCLLGVLSTLLTSHYYNRSLDLDERTRFCEQLLKYEIEK